MIEYLAEYPLFLLKVATIVVGVVVFIAVAAAAGRKATQEGLEVENLNKKYKSIAGTLRNAVQKKDERKKTAKEEKKQHKAEQKSEALPRCFVIDFKGDLKASAVPSLREEVSAVLDVATPDDKVIVRLENHGGIVHEHGLAASQLARIRDRDIPLIVCVDKVAASGGYLMACVASKIYAAPFAILGSIGVLAQIPNFRRLLDSHGVDFEQITAGKYKRTVTMFGKNTDEDRAKLKEELEDVHALFKSAVSKYRPDLDLDKVATGEHWFGRDALALNLCDAIGTSDDWLMNERKDADLLHVHYRRHESLSKRIGHAVSDAPARALERVLRRIWKSRLV